MAGKPLAQDQLQQSTQIAQAIARQSEAQERRMLNMAQEKWQRAHGHLVAMVRQLDPEYGDASEKGNLRLAQLGDDDLAYLINVRLRMVVAGTQKILDIERQRQELFQAARRCAELEARGVSLVDENRLLQEKNNSLNAKLIALQQPQPLSTAAPREPIQAECNSQQEASQILPEGSTNWMGREEFEQAQVTLCVMGETGKALRPSILRETARRLNLSPDDKEVTEAVERLINAEDKGSPALIERIDVAPGQGSSSGDTSLGVLRLTEEGKSAHLRITGKIAVENEYDRLVELFDSCEQAVLILRSVEVLEAAGYLIKGIAQEIRLSDSTFVADIAVVAPSSGEAILIAVERDLRERSLVRKQKWVSLWEAAHGNIYVICEDVACQREVQNEINVALRGLRFSSFLTNLQHLDSGQRSEDGGIWLSGKQARCLERLPY